MASQRPRAVNAGKKKRKDRDWSAVSLDQFMSEGLEDLSECEEETQTRLPAKKKIRKNLSKQSKAEQPKKSKTTKFTALEKTDSDFYSFLKEEDPGLLEFDLLGEEEEEGEEDEEEHLEEDGEEGQFVPESVPASVTSYASKQSGGNDEGEEESDDFDSTDEEDDDVKGRKTGRDIPKRNDVVKMADHDSSDEDEWAGENPDGTPVSVAMVKSWVVSITEEVSPEAVSCLIGALHCGVIRMAHLSSKEEQLQYRVDDGQVFNSLLVASLKHFRPFLISYLKLRKTSIKVNPTSSQNWKSIKSQVKLYMEDLVSLLLTLRETSMLAAILKQILALSQYCIQFPRIVKGLLKRLVVVWSEGEEETRVLAFLNIRQFVLLQDHPALAKILKRMYLSFVRTCKLTTPSTLPSTHLMEHSLVEMCRLDPPTTYHNAFIYIRQLGIHLRSALASKSKDSLQPVTNWQYLHCVELWAKVLAEVDHPSLQPLVFPLVQVMLGLLQLLKANKYAPLRLHCLSYLLLLSEKRGVFVPTAPHLTSLMHVRGSSKKTATKGGSGQLMGKPLDLSCMIKLSQIQLSSSSAQSSLLDRAYELLLEYFAIHSHRIAFPECCLPTVIELRKVAKNTQFSWFKRQLRQLIEKVEQVSSEVSRSRSSVHFAPKDLLEVETWERERQEEKNALKTFLSSWKQMRSRQQVNSEDGNRKRNDSSSNSGATKDKPSSSEECESISKKGKKTVGGKQESVSKKGLKSINKEPKKHLKQKRKETEKEASTGEDIVTDMFSFD